MDNKLPDFFLGSSEHRGDWAIARACWVTGRIRMEGGRESGREGVLVLVAPPVIGQPYGLGAKDVDHLVLVPRWKGSTFVQPMEHPPMAVFIFRILQDGLAMQGVVHDSDVEMDAWGEIYPTLEAAKQAAHKVK